MTRTVIVVMSEPLLSIARALAAAIEERGEEATFAEQIAAAAHECLRQMEWAYRQGANDMSGDPVAGVSEDDRLLGITEIAPDDWRPE